MLPPISQLRVQLIEDRLGVFQVGGVEAFGELVVDPGEHRASLVALALLVEHPGEARRGTQLECFRAHAPGDADRFPEIAGCLGFIAALDHMPTQPPQNSPPPRLYSHAPPAPTAGPPPARAAATASTTARNPSAASTCGSESSHPATPE